MAKVERRTVAPQPPPVEYVITLSEYEAKGLRALLYAGVGNVTLRELGLSELSMLLAKAGVDDSRNFKQSAQL